MAELVSLLALPDEILTNILFYLDPDSLNAVQPASRRLQSVAGQEILWRYNCHIHFRHWNPKHNYTALLQRPVAQVPWRQLFVQRKRIEAKARRLVDELVATHKQRGTHIEWLAEQGYDVKDELLRQKSVDEEQEDVLARRYWANAALTAIHRSMAMEEWARLRRGEPTSLERVLGAYDLFVIDSAEGIGDLDDISARLDDLAARFKSQHPEYPEVSLRERALCLVEFLRAAGFTGVPPERYGRIEQSFIGLALAGDNHEALPLVTVAIFCCVAERLGINAQPCGYPMHIYAIVKAPLGESLDGPDASTTSKLSPEDSDTMYLDPFRSEQEVLRSRLESQLMSWGASPQDFPMFLSSASMRELVIRSARNMRRAVEVGGEAEPQQPPGAARLAHSHLDLNAALHAAMWAWAYLERGGNASVEADLVTRRRRILMTKAIQLILEHVPWETFLAERYMGPLFCDLPESPDFARVIGEHTNQAHGTWASAVRHTIGTPFRHARYSYYGVIIGWDPSCSAAEEWVVTMDVDRLPHGRAQPFYNVLCEDSTARYVAEENIAPTREKPPEWLRGGLAGRYFLRWDEVRRRFVSNVREEYPDD
ncbi:hypothetical protein IWX90DRAFT_379025 [Phyllosticta citrichinensis]|uniref:F-box domain-containing protein n=1 Tax=Phyllosticta citrichinensis TaxID=1130410 RepID=A0ABR1Y1I0_9PEZI